MYIEQPLQSGTLGCKIEKAEPKNIIEKINKMLNENEKQSQERLIHDQLWKLQNETATAIRILAEEIDALKVLIEEMK
jgi:hypothetical protein